MAESFAEGLVGIVLDDRYRLDAVLGEGGMGAVFRATHLAMDRRVAVKLLKPHLTQDKTALERFAREARSTLKVESPHAVKVLDYGVTPQNDYYMALEYLDGRTVQRELDVDGPFAPQRVLHIAKHALLALGAAHRIGIVHRDIKPDNLLLMRVGDDADFTKVLDFGVAKLMEGAARSTRSQLSLTQAGMVFGTPEFMSPEQACGQPLDPRSDLYSLAATMFAMLTGCGMFPAASAIEWLTSHVRTPAPHLVDGNPALAGLEPLDAMLQTCFAKHASDRFGTAEEMIAAIEQVERDLGVVKPAPLPKLHSTFSPSAFIPALGVERAADSTIVPTIAPPAPLESVGTSIVVKTTTSNPHLVEAVEPSRRGLWLLIGALAIAGVIVAAIVIASAGKKPAQKPVALKIADAPTAVLDATQIVVAPIDAAAIATPDASTPAFVPATTPKKHSDFDDHIQLALAAQKAGKRMTQVTQAHAAYLLDPKNPKAVLLLADGLLAEGDLEHGCKYLRELARNPIAQQRMRSANCPAE
ncbi:MAG: serine/threonine-protein kinase [Kofleriaceae bacterium]